MAVAN